MTPAQFWWNILNYELIWIFYKHMMYYMKQFNTTGHAPKLNSMENEASASIELLLQKRKIVLQLSPPHIHRQNESKCSICIFKNHFVAGLASVDNNFPIYLWCCIVR